MAASITGSFVEVYKATVGGGGGAAGAKSKNGHKPLDGDAPPRDIFEAARRGDLRYLRDSAASAGTKARQLLASRDDAGHTAAHWASLHGQLEVLEYLASLQEDGASWSLCCQPSEHELGQQPIHWACVNGHLTVVKFLLDRAGAGLDQRDAKGATPLLVACQYGQTVAVTYLMGRGAALTVADNEGDTALHWAAFKGQSDLVRLLVYAGCEPQACDSYGQTPLHFACIGGSLQVVRDLCRVDKVAIDVPDKSGRTPLQLAAGRRHLEIEHFLEAELRSRTSLLGGGLKWTHLLFGPPGKTRAPMLFFLVCVIAWGYPNYAFRALPATIDQHPWLNFCFVGFNALMWFCFYHTNLTDPGYLPRNAPDYDQAIRLAGSGASQLDRLCHTCRTVKPLRAKHCRICDRCVVHMDHHCPYVYNCVGANNRHTFLLFVTFCTLAGSISLTLVYITWTIEGRPRRWDYMIGVPLQILFGLLLILINRYGWYNAIKNMTTNEMINGSRYNYLQDGQGKFHNPFDRGAVNNLMEFFYLRQQRDLEELLTMKEPMAV